MATALAGPRRLSFGPWLFGAGVDLGVFGGSAVLAFGLVALGRALGFAPGPLPEWGWLLFVVGVDVAHVWSTLFRTYLDREEVARHRLRYFGLPILVWAIGVVIHLQGSLMFWRVLAYVAVFHFIRQQVGWVAVYRARAGQRGMLDRLIDDATVYVASLYPVVHWHAHLRETDFSWFVKGDFVDLGQSAARVLPVVRAAWVVLLIAFVARQVAVAAQTRVLHLGKSIVVLTTAAIWFGGIVATNSDFEFTVTNVLIHGVPYFALLHAYARARKREAPDALGSHIVAGGIGAFMGVLLLLAFVEEAAWDQLIWHDRPWLFDSAGIELSPLVAALVVPLLALPQATHYALDGLLWRRGDTRSRPAQRRALGFEG